MESVDEHGIPVKYPLTSKNSPPILPPVESNVLSNKPTPIFANIWVQKRSEKALPISGLRNVDMKVKNSEISVKEKLVPIFLKHIGLSHLVPSAVRISLERRKVLLAIASNSGWLLVDKLTRILLGLIVGVWVARYLGPHQFGQLAFVISYIAFFQAVANLGLDGIIVRDIAKNAAVAPQILGTAFALRFATGLGCWAISVIGMYLISGDDSQTLLLTALIGAGLIFQAADTVDLWFQSQSQSRRTVIAKLVGYLLSNGLKVALVLANAPLSAFAAVIALDTLASAFGLAIAYRRFPTRGRWKAVRQQASTLLRECWPFMLSGLSIMVYMRIDQIMLKEMLGDRELGIYSAALQVSQVWHVIPITLATSLAPFVAQKRSLGEDQYYDALVRIFRLFGSLAVLLSIVTSIASSALVGLLYGAAYAEAAPVLAIHVFSNFFVFQGVAQGLWLANEGAGRLSLAKTALGGVTAILGNLLLLPLFGTKGAAIVAIASFGISAVLSNALFAPRILLMQLGFRQRS